MALLFGTITLSTKFKFMNMGTHSEAAMGDLLKEFIELVQLLNCCCGVAISFTSDPESKLEIFLTGRKQMLMGK
jgi:hypothetical protein